MKKSYCTLIVAAFLMLAGTALADQGKGLNVVVTTADRQAQMMAMVLSVQTMKEHGKEINRKLSDRKYDNLATILDHLVAKIS